MTTTSSKKFYQNARRPPAGIYMPYNGDMPLPHLGCFVIETGCEGTYRLTDNGTGVPEVELFNGASGFGRIAVSAYGVVDKPRWRLVMKA